MLRIVCHIAAPFAPPSLGFVPEMLMTFLQEQRAIHEQDCLMAPRSLGSPDHCVTHLSSFSQQGMTQGKDACSFWHYSI